MRTVSRAWTALLCAAVCSVSGTAYGDAVPDPVADCPAGLVCLTEPEARDLLTEGVAAEADAASWRALGERVPPPVCAEPAPWWRWALAPLGLVGIGFGAGALVAS